MNHHRKHLLFFLAALLLLLRLAVGVVSAGGDPPKRITVYAPVRNVHCALGVCCGSVSATYRGHHYDAGPRGYCRWFHSLGDGQTVRATLYLAW
jgi:hypothetical protein